MKRFIFLVSTLSFFITAYPENKGFSRWSFAPEYGYNVFDGDIQSGKIQFIPTSFQQISYGATLEYALTPIWGVSLDYFYFPLSAKNNSNTIEMKTDFYTSDLNATINFTRLLFPQTKSKIYVNGGIGLGYAYYTFNVTPISEQIVTNNGKALSIPVTLSLEYNFSKALAFGAKVQYRSINKDDLEGVTKLNYKGNSNDIVGSGTLFLRYKFNSGKKDHLRNIKMDVFSPDNGLILSKLNADKINKLDIAINKLEGIINYQNRLIDSINVIVANVKSVSDAEVVPDMRALEPLASVSSTAGLKGKLLKVTVNTSKSKEHIEDVPAVYFDLDKIELDGKALDAIGKIAFKMKADPTLYVEVRGYCDNLVNDKVNNLLSQRRSDRVKAELVNSWKIPYNHIITNGNGNVLESKLKYRPTRRCDFFFVKL